MLFELKKEEASSLICIPHQTFGCFRVTSMLLWKLLPGLPSESTANLIVYAAAISPAVRSTVELYGAPTRRRHRPLSCDTGHQRGVGIARRHKHGGAVRGTNAALTLPIVECTVGQYGVPTRRRHRPPSGARWPRAIVGTNLNAVSTSESPPVESTVTVEQYEAPTSPPVRSTVDSEWYGAPTRRRHRPPSGVR